MKSCNGCAYAEWERTASGRLHPSGVGKCTYKVALPELPSCMSWRSCFGDEIKPIRHAIERHRELLTDCKFYIKDMAVK
jgi:hypothetical protein